MNDIPFLAVVIIWGMITAVFWAMTYRAEISMFLACAVCGLLVTFQPYVCGYTFLLICFVLVTLRVLKDHKELVVLEQSPLTNAIQVDHPVYGFKVLSRDNNGVWYSPVYGDKWKDGHLTAHSTPTMDNDYGIWVFKKESDAYQYSIGLENSYVLLVVISGECVEHEEGYRAEHGDTVKVIRKGR